MNLTAQQLHFFDTFGFLQFPGLLAQEAEAITAAFEEVWVGAWWGARWATPRPQAALRTRAVH